MSIPEIVGSVALVAIALFAFCLAVWVLRLRRVVSPSEVHIVQSQGSGRVAYGLGEGGVVKNSTYYEWPVWLPRWGVQVSKLPLTVFDQDLKGYDAYDKDRVPFKIDVKAFYRIYDPQIAAERISNMHDLKAQLAASLQGAVRKILSEHTIEEIMHGRSEFGTKFTQEVDGDLAAWGVKTVKSIELMDIRDSDEDEGGPIQAIMAKRVSGIDKESRVEVAENKRAAEEAEIAATRQIELQRQEAAQQIGLRKAEVVKQVGIADQTAVQEVAVAEKATTTAQMEVKREADTKKAEIHKQTAAIDAEREKAVAIVAAERDRAVKTVQAEADKQVAVVTAEAEKERLTLTAEGQLVMSLKQAEGVRANGEAQGAALLAEKMAPVTAELKLQEGIGQNTAYQQYMVDLRQVAANEEVGKAQAAALEKADVRIIANTGDPAKGLSGVAELFTPGGGLKVASAIEGFATTELGQRVLSKLGISPEEVKELAVGTDQRPRRVVVKKD